MAYTKKLQRKSSKRETFIEKNDHSETHRAAGKKKKNIAGEGSTKEVEKLSAGLKNSFKGKSGGGRGANERQRKKKSFVGRTATKGGARESVRTRALGEKGDAHIGATCQIRAIEKR